MNKLFTLASRTILASALAAAALSGVACGGDERALLDPSNDGTDDSCVDCELGLDTDGDVVSSSTNNGICATLDGKLASVTPTVVLLVDQSSSMSAGYGDQERWDALYDAVMDETDGVVATLDGQVRFGLTLYTSENGGATCPMLTEVDVALDNFTSIDEVWSQATYVDDTPTGESLAQTAAKLAALDLDGPKAIILATDGEPDTCDKPDPNTGDNLTEARAMSVQAAQDAFDMGVQTHVLSVGDDIADEHLQDMADAGTGAPAGDATFYRPGSKAELVEDIRRIVEGERSCVFAIDGSVDTEALADAEIIIDGEPVVYGQDWKLRDAGHIEILGAACEALMSGDHEVEGTFYCPDENAGEEVPEIK